MRLALTFVVTTMLLIAQTATVRACTCAPPPPPKKALKKSAAVFSGTVTSIKQVGSHNLVTLQIKRTWKGTKGKTVTVKTHTSSAACGYQFRKGTAYLVYCFQPPKNKKTKQLQTNICTRTKPLARAKEDLKELGPGKKP